MFDLLDLILLCARYPIEIKWRAITTRKNSISIAQNRIEIIKNIVSAILRTLVNRIRQRTRIKEILIGNSNDDTNNIRFQYYSSKKITIREPKKKSLPIGSINITSKLKLPFFFSSVFILLKMLSTWQLVSILSPPFFSYNTNNE